MRKKVNVNTLKLYIKRNDKENERRRGTDKWKYNYLQEACQGSIEDILIKEILAGDEQSEGDTSRR